MSYLVKVPKFGFLKMNGETYRITDTTVINDGDKIYKNLSLNCISETGDKVEITLSGLVLDTRDLDHLKIFMTNE